MTERREASREPAARFVPMSIVVTVAGALGQFFCHALAWVGLWRDAYGLAEHTLLGLLVYSVLGIGLIEEFAKLLPFLVCARFLTHFDFFVL